MKTIKGRIYTIEEKMNYYNKQIHELAHMICEAESLYEAMYWVRQIALKAKRIENIASKNFIEIARSSEKEEEEQK